MSETFKNILGQTVGGYTAADQLYNPSNNSYAPAQQIGGTLSLGLTITDSQLYFAAAGAGAGGFYAPVGTVIGKLGLGIGVAVDAGGVAYGVLAGNEQQLFSSGASLIVGGGVGAAGFIIAGPAGAAIGYSIGSFVAGKIVDSYISPELPAFASPSMSVSWSGSGANANFNSLPQSLGGGTLESSSPFSTNLGDYSTPWTGVAPADGTGYSAPDPFGGASFNNLPDSFGGGTLQSSPQPYILDTGANGGQGGYSPPYVDPPPSINYQMPPGTGGDPAGSTYQGEPGYTAPPIDYQMPATQDPSSPDAGSLVSSNYGSGGSGGSGGGTGPVVLDLAGNGIKITQLTSSSMFFDMTGDGYKNHTAWAGAGNGVLFVDMTGQGQLTQANQVVFRDWDPSATSDMQALADVFDTNHNGSLDAGDADFSKFFVVETNANGTQSVYSLAQLGITSINLTANNVNEALPDGSSIDGETTFTYSNGTTGTAATVTFAYDTQGHVVTTTTTTNADGSTTVQNVADNADGSLAYQNILNTSADGQTKTLTDLDNGGLVTALQTDVTTIANGVTTETLTNYANGAIQANGELTSSGVTGDKKLNSTQTVTNGGTVTISRDQIGGGWTTQQEVQTFSGAALVSDTLSDLNPDGSASSVTTTTTTNGGLTTTTTTLVDNIAADSTSVVDSTIIGEPSGSILSQRTETVTDSKGTTTIGKTITQTATTANSVTATTSNYLADGTTLDGTNVQSTVTNSNGSTTTTQIDYAANGAFLDETVTNIDPTGLLKTTSIDANGDGTAAAPAFTSIVTDNTVVNSDNSRTETVTTYAQNNTLQSQTITWRATGGPARNVTTYATGDGASSQTEGITVNSSGATVDILSNLAANGTLANQTVTTTSADGLSKTIQINTTGATSNGSSTFDHTTSDVTVHNSDGSTTETVTDYGATTSNLIDKTQTTTSGDGLTTTIDKAFMAASLSAGRWDRVSTDATVVNSDGSLTETITDNDGYGNILDTTVKQSSGNRQVVTNTTMLGTTNLVKIVETVATQSNGTVVDTRIRFDSQGDVLGATQTTTGADGLAATTQDDVRGQSAAAYSASGLSFDLTTSDTTVINADGSRAETVNVTSNSGALESQSVASTSANGLTVTTTKNPFATSAYATKSIVATTYNADGGRTVAQTDYSYGGTEIDQTLATASATGLSNTTTRDFNGDGTVDQSTTDNTTINPDGSRTEVVTDYTGATSGTVRDVTTTTSGIILVGLGDETTITRQSNGSVATYQVETIAPDAAGTEWDTTQFYASQGGPQLLETTNAINANGLVKTSYTAVNGDTSWDFWTQDATAPNADGSATETIATRNKSALLDETVVTTSANGLSKTTSVDANGAVDASGAAVFNLVTTDATVLNNDGSETEAVTNYNANGAEIDWAVTITSADQQTVTSTRYLDETGSLATADQTETTQTQANGDVVDIKVSYDSNHNVIDTVTETTSGNGLSKTKTYVNGAGTTTDSETDTTTFDANGDGGTLNDAEHNESIGGSILSSSLKTQSTANDEFVTATLILTGALVASNINAFTAVASETTTIASTGATTKTTVDTLNDGSSAADTTTVVTSANGLITTTSTALGSANPYIVTVATTNTDGSSTTTSTYYNPSTMGATAPTVEDTETVNKSWDGRTVATTQRSDFDGTNYNVQTDTTVDNANGTTTTTRSGTGSWGAGAFDVVTNAITNPDGSTSTTVQNYTAPGGTALGQSVTTVSGNGLETAMAMDVTGTETFAKLQAAATDLLNGAALSAGLLATDVIGLDVKALNADGSSTETDTTYFGSRTTERSQTVTTTSANGLVMTRKVDADGNGIFEQIDTTTVAPDGSKTEVMDYYANAGATAGQLTATDTLTTSADGLVTVLTISTGATDTTTTFANANGSYQWSRAVSNTASGLYGGSATHDIDANGIDAWSWSDFSPGGSSGSISIALATEQQDIAQANMIYTTVLGHSMTDAETQYLAQYIQNGVLNRTALATALVTSTEYQSDYGVGLLDGSGFNYMVNVDFLNVLGRLPSSSELAQFVSEFGPTSSTLATTQTLASAAVAIAQYATDWTGGGVSRLAALGQGLAASLAAGNAKSWRYSIRVIPDKHSPAFDDPPPPPHYEPLILNLTGDSTLTESLNAGVYFDYNNNGFEQATGWAAPGQGILVYDPSGGNITNGSELFGTSMQLADGTFAVNGFQALAQFDTNGDGKIDSNDSVWSALKVWVNSDGTPGSGQLLSLDQAGISSINLTNTVANITDSQGNQILATGSFNWSAGGSGQMADLNFLTDPTLSTPDTTMPVPAEIAALPDLPGYGAVTTLRQAMALDTSGTLEGLVNQFIAATTDSQRDSLVDQIIIQWAGVEGVSPSARGSYVNGQELAALEKFVGRAYTDPTTGSSDPSSNASAALVSAAYDNYHDQVYAELMTKTVLASLFQSVVPTVNSATHQSSWDFSAAQINILSGLSTDRADTLTLLGEFNRSIHALGMDTNSGYAAFRSALAAQGADVAATFPFGTPVVEGTVGDDVITAWAGNQTIYGNGGHDVLIGAASNEVFYGGGSGGTTFVGGPGNETFIGGANDPIFNGPGDTFIASGGGNYKFQGATDNDTYIFTAGGGNVTIFDYGGDDTLKLGAGLTAATVTITGASNGKDLIITDGIPGDQITISGVYHTSRAIAESMTLVYGDGTSTNLSNSQAAFYSTTGTSGDDTLYGSLGADVFDGKGGNDTEIGFGGGDTFIYNPGYGSLEIEETANNPTEINLLKLGSGITPEQISVTADASGDAYLTDGISGDVIKLDGQLSNSLSGVQQVQFADGTVWTAQQIIAMELNGTSGADKLYGTSGSDTFDGKGAPAGSQDYEQGNGGGDVFIFNAGYGHLEISETDFASSPHNVLQLGAGIGEAQVVVTGDGSNNLYLTDGGDQVKLDSELGGGYYGVQSVQFADGTTWTKAQLIAMATTGTSGADKLYGTSGSDTFDGKGAPAGSQDYEQGNGGGDVFIFNAGYGHLEISEDAGYGHNSTATLLLSNINAAQVSVSNDSSGNIYLTDGVSGDQVKIDNMWSSARYGVGSIQFADGTTWSRTQTLAAVTYNYQLGSGNLSINNAVSGGTAPEGQLDFSSGLNEENLWFIHSGNNLVIDILGTQNSVTVQGWFGSNPSAQLTEIKGSDGLEIDSQLNQLVSAMATFQSNNPSFNPTTATQMPSDTTLQNTIATAWHH